MDVAGRCRCERVRYRLVEEPVAFYLCHCTDCQAESGSAFGQSMHVRRGALVDVSGELRRHDALATDGSTLSFHECPVCRTLIWAERPDGPILGLNAGTLVDVGGLTPWGNMWTRSARPWVEFAPGPCFEMQPDAPDAMARAWRERPRAEASNSGGR